MRGFKSGLRSGIATRGNSKREGSSSLLSPADFPDDTFSLWFDASDLPTITIDSGASFWLDKSGNNRHLSQSTATQRPALTLNAQNGLSVLTFDGSNDFMFNPSVGASGRDVVQMLAVFRLITGGSSEDIPMGVGQTNSPGAIRVFYRAPNGLTVGFGTWQGNDLVSSVHSYDIGGSFHIFEAWNTQRASPDQIRIGRDGVITTSSLNNLSPTVDGFSVGSLFGSSVGAYYANLAVGEILVSYSELSSLNRQLAEGYLAWKWGLQSFLPTIHPFSARAPVISDLRG